MVNFVGCNVNKMESVKNVFKKKKKTEKMPFTLVRTAFKAHTNNSLLLMVGEARFLNKVITSLVARKF